MYLYNEIIKKCVLFVVFEILFTTKRYIRFVSLEKKGLFMLKADRPLGIEIIYRKLKSPELTGLFSLFIVFI